MTSHPTFGPNTYLLHALRRWRRTLIGCTCLGTAAAWVASPPTAPLFRGVARITVAAPVQPLFTESQPVVRESDEFIRTQCAVIASSAVLERAAAAMQKEFSGGGGAGAAGAGGGGGGAGGAGG